MVSASARDAPIYARWPALVQRNVLAFQNSEFVEATPMRNLLFVTGPRSPLHRKTGEAAAPVSTVTILTLKSGSDDLS